MFEVTGLDLLPYIKDWYWDGNPAAMKVFSRRLVGARGHMCLQHAKKLTAKRCSGGCVALVPRLQEMIAFMAPPLMHRSIVALFRRLDAVGPLNYAKF